MYKFFEGGFLDLDPLENLVKVDEEVSEAWQRGEIPQTPSNEKQLLRLHTAYHDLQALLQRQSVLTEENWKVVTKSILTIKKALERIRQQVSSRPQATASVCRAYTEPAVH